MRAALALAVAVVTAVGSSGPSARLRQGAQVFAYSGCFDCHTYAGVGRRRLAAPDLTAETRRARGEDWQVRHLRSPATVVPGSKMPAFRELRRDELDTLVAFLEESDGQWDASDFWYGSGV